MLDAIQLPNNLNLNKFAVIFNDYNSIEQCINNDYFEAYISNFKRIKYSLNDKNAHYKYKNNDVNSHLGHILKTIKHVDELDISEQDKQKLRMIMFFHDLGKCEGVAGHERLSADIADQTLTRLGYSKEYISFVSQVVKYHSAFGIYPKQKVELQKLDKEVLRFIYLATSCDIGDRLPFDTKANRQKIYDCYMEVLENGDNVEIKLNLISKVMKQNLKFITGFSHYCFKDLLYEIDMKNIQNIAWCS